MADQSFDMRHGYSVILKEIEDGRRGDLTLILADKLQRTRDLFAKGRISGLDQGSFLERAREFVDDHGWEGLAGTEIKDSGNLRKYLEERHLDDEVIKLRYADCIAANVRDFRQERRQQSPNELTRDAQVAAGELLDRNVRDLRTIARGLSEGEAVSGESTVRVMKPEEIGAGGEVIEG